MTLFLGVDGGGTKTDFLLIDASGKVLAAQREGSAYYPEIGIEALQDRVVQGIRATLARGLATPSDITFACIGLPSFGEDSALTARLGEIASAVLPIERYRCVNDMVCGWAAALGCLDGINIVAGTGSIGYGEFERETARAGGWGELFSDEGSAHWVACQALNLFSRMSDGRNERGPLYALIREHFKLHADLDVCAAIYGPPAMSRSEVAALAPIVARAAGAGDTQAKLILEKAAQQLAAIVHAIRSQLHVPPDVLLPVSYSGGMFHRASLLTRLLKESLQSSGRQYEFAEPLLAPRAGAALYAAKLAGAPLPPVALAQLTRTHGAAVENDPR